MSGPCDAVGVIPTESGHENTENSQLPGFVGEVTLPGRIVPVRAWIHGGNLIGAYGNAQGAADYFKEFYSTVEDELDDNSSRPSLENAPYDFALAMVWANTADGEVSRNVDLFPAYDVDWDNWQANIEYDKCVFRDGTYVEGPAVTCGDGMIMLGAEEKYRRSVESLDEFMASPPHLKLKSVSRRFHDREK